MEDYNPYHMDCLPHPEKYASVIHTDECTNCADERACAASCMFDAIEEVEGNIRINPEKCTGCGVCVDACKLEKLSASKDVFPVLKTVREKKGMSMHSLRLRLRDSLGSR